MANLGNVLVTGGAGYVGSHVCKVLAGAGYCPVTFDDLSAGHAWALAAYTPRAVIHLAGLTSTIESQLFPRRYERANAVELRRLRSVLVPFALVIAWSLVQAASWTPQTWHHPMWAAMASRLSSVNPAISIDPTLALTAAMRLLAHGGIFWLAVQLGRDRVRAKLALTSVAWAGIVYASYGLLIYFSGTQTILGMEKWAYLSDLTATFVNRNAYGAYAGIGMVLCIGLAIQALRANRHSRDRRAFDMAEGVFAGALPYMVGALVMASALLLSHSRGAFLSTGAGIGVLILSLVAGRAIRPRMALLLSSVIIGIGLVVLSVSGDITVKRLAEETGQEQEPGTGRRPAERLSPHSGFQGSRRRDAIACRGDPLARAR